MIEERSYFWMGYVVLAIVVFIPIIMLMDKTAQGDAFNEQLISHDISLLTDITLGVPGEVEVSYYLNNSQEDFYNVWFNEGCEISVAYKDTSILSAARTVCPDNLNLEKEYGHVMHFSTLFLKKEGNRFSVGGVD